MSDRPCRIVNVVVSLDAGGLENGIINVANRLDGKAEIHVACLERAGRLAERLNRPDRLHILGKPAGFSVRAVSQLRRCLLSVRPHVVHTHNLGPLIYGALATKGGRTIPVLHSEHGQIAPDDLTWKRRWQRRWFIRCATALHAVSQELAADLTSHRLGQKPWRAIRNGVDSDRFTPGDREAARRAFGIPGTGPLLGMVSRFGPHKRHDVLIAAFETLRNRGIDVRLVLVGAGGPEEARIRRRSRSSAHASAIHWLGFTPAPERVYPALDLLVLPSVNEGLSNVTLEAMACGVPVLSHSACGGGEIIRSGVDGVVTDLFTAEKLAEALAQLLGDQASLRAMGRLARESVLQRFSLDRMADEYLRLYSSLCRPEPFGSK